jgi:hypothetical protein
VYRVSEVRQIKIHTDELLVPDPNPSEVEIATSQSNKYK